MWHIGQGLPDLVEEAMPWKRAFEMWGWGGAGIDWNPHFFHYPSLSFYLHFALQHLHYELGRMAGVFRNPADYFVAYEVDPTPMIALGRLLGVAADAVMVWLAWRLGQRWRAGTGLLAATLMCFAGTAIRESRLIYTDTLMTAFAMGAVDRMLAYWDTGSRRALVQAAALIGLAAGTKYPAGLLVAVLAGVAWRREPRHGARVAALAMVGALAIFIATTPFAVLDFAKFRSDVLGIAEIVQTGVLGTLERRGFPYYVQSLASDLGPAALVFLSISSWFAFVRRSPVGVLLWLYLLVIGVPISVGRVEAERYIVQLMPAVVILVAAGAVAVLERAPQRARAIVTAGILVALLLPAVQSGLQSAGSGVDTTQGEARRWIERHLSDHELLVQELYGARLRTPEERERWREHPVVRAASPALQQRLLEAPVVRTVTLPLVVAGGAAFVSSEREGRRRDIELFPRRVDINRVFYDPRLFTGADLVLTSDAVRGRFERDSAGFAVQTAFYRVLDATAPVVVTFESSGPVSGPRIRIHRVTPRTREEIARRFGPLPPWWWAEQIPDRARRAIEESVTDGHPISGGAIRMPDGSAAPWVVALQPMFVEFVGEFAYRMAVQLEGVGRCDEARTFAAAVLGMVPDDAGSAGVYERCSERLGRR